ncbi:MAG: SAM-dependent chlorinase/fluorinase [bacterium]|nr:SAM-dependent chlorinase/fluorinase [bacterium]
MPDSPIITLTTDFGGSDTYVAQMKGAIARVDPRLRVVDLTHQAPAHDVHAAGYLLETGYAAFPRRTVHVVVVDPGVGTPRRALALRSERYDFLGPDNGVLSRILDRERDLRVYAIDERRFATGSVSRTFEGRDRFAPAAAWLAGGLDPAELGPAVDDCIRLSRFRHIDSSGALTIAALHADRFGNVVLDVTAAELEDWLGCAPRRDFAPRLLDLELPVERFGATFADAPPGESLLLINSAGYLEVAVNRGRADALGCLRRGRHVRLTPPA